MPRKPVVRSNEHFYHIVARTNNKEPFWVDDYRLWQIMSNHLGLLQKEHQLEIGAFVLMSNHFHLLMRTPNEDIDRIMYLFMKKITSSIQKESGRINRIFGGRYKGCVIENERYFMNVYKYIYRNPIAAGLCQRAEDYLFSTLWFEMNQKNLKFQIHHIHNLSRNVLNWINESFDSSEVASIKHGLSKTSFVFKKDRETRLEIAPEGLPWLKEPSEFLRN